MRPRAEGAPADGAAHAAGGGATRIGAGALLRSAAAGEAARAGPHLLVREPRAGERVVPLTSDCTVGRGRAANLRLADPSASRLHLRLRLDEAGASVEDLGSCNGLRVNGARTRGARRLRSGDRLEVGATVLCYLDPLERAGAGPVGPGAAPRRASAAGLAALASALLAVAAAALAWG